MKFSTLSATSAVVSSIQSVSGASLHKRNQGTIEKIEESSLSNTEIKIVSNSEVDIQTDQNINNDKDLEEIPSQSESNSFLHVLNQIIQRSQFEKRRGGSSGGRVGGGGRIGGGSGGSSGGGSSGGSSGGGGSGGSTGGGSGSSGSSGGRPPPAGVAGGSRPLPAGSRPLPAGYRPMMAPTYGGAFPGGAGALFLAGGVSLLGLVAFLALASSANDHLPGYWGNQNNVQTYTYNATVDNEPYRVTCYCIMDQACGCDKNTDKEYFDALRQNKTIAKFEERDGVTYVYINGTAPVEDAQYYSQESSSTGEQSGAFSLDIPYSAYLSLGIAGITLLL